MIKHGPINIFNSRYTAAVLLLAASVVLVIDPVLWLVRTWQDPSYDSQGFLVFAVCLALFIWSVTSRLSVGYTVPVRFVFLLFLGTASIRAAGQLLSINTIGALALVIDIYALGLLFGLQYRKRAVSPGWLALAFMLSLPIERIIQRTIGYGLQNFSADGACLLLQTVFADIQCDGIRIVLENKDILVDLPCSGARTAVMLFFLYTITASICRPSIVSAVTGLGVTIAAALMANIIRIAFLAFGIARPEYLHGINVMEQPWHDIAGLVALTLAALPILIWAGKAHHPLDATQQFSHNTTFFPTCNTLKTVIAGILLIISVAIVLLPRKAVDVVKRGIPLSLPTYLSGYMAIPLPLQAKEQAYFTKYGGSALKAAYGPFNLLAVRTSAPLRHLHTPDECLRGLGYKVYYSGMTYTPVPTANYRVEDKQGRRFLVSVSFVSDRGHITTNVSEAVWIWLQNPTTTWTAIQRISPLEIPEQQRQHWNTAVLTGFDLPLNKYHTALFNRRSQ